MQQSLLNLTVYIRTFLVNFKSSEMLHMHFDCQRFDKLVEERIEKYLAQFGPASDCPDLKEPEEFSACT